MSVSYSPRLDDRLRTAADMAPRCRVMADIGADHARLSAYVLANRIAGKMIVSDISRHSIRRANETLEKFQVSDRAVVRLADGFDAVDEPVGCAFVLGMGGRTLSQILRKADKRFLPACLIVSVHTDLVLLRETLYMLQYHIEEERVVRASGRFYVIIKAVQGFSGVTDEELAVGFHVSAATPELLKEYYAWRIDVLSEHQNDAAAEQIQWIRKRMDE